MRIVDGSGLSSLDRLTAAALVGVIRAGLDEPPHPGRIPRLARRRGADGTLGRAPAPALAAVVRGKTGTTSLACSLSGVVNGSVAFAVIQNGSPVAFWPARAAQDRFVTALADRYARPPGLRAAARGAARRGRASSRTGTPAFWAFATFEPGLSPDDHARGLLRHGVRDLRAERLERLLRLLAGEALERAGDHVLATGERPLDRPLRLTGAPS